MIITIVIVIVIVLVIINNNNNNDNDNDNDNSNSNNNNNNNDDNDNDNDNTKLYLMMARMAGSLSMQCHAGRRSGCHACGPFSIQGILFCCDKIWCCAITSSLQQDAYIYLITSVSAIIWEFMGNYVTGTSAALTLDVCT